MSLHNSFDLRYISLRDGKNVDTYGYKANDQMYVDQMKYFMDNLRNPYLMNNIFEASNLFEKIIEIREKVYEAIDNNLRATE